MCAREREREREREIQRTKVTSDSAITIPSFTPLIQPVALIFRIATLLPAASLSAGFLMVSLSVQIVTKADVVRLMQEFSLPGNEPIDYLSCQIQRMARTQE